LPYRLRYMLELFKIREAERGIMERLFEGRSFLLVLVAV
jgi:hypothetical protein